MKTNTRGQKRASAALVALATSVAALFCAPIASAGLPTHPRLPGGDLAGFNRACGTAVDSNGVVYVASAGESKVRIFDAAHAELASIANAHQPCGLAIDSKGNVYVSETETGEVVRYSPSSYPVTATSTYGSASTIDASGIAAGVAVDSFDDSLYVAEGSRIAVYDSDGTSAAANDVQSLSVFEATGGTFTLSFDGQESAPLAYNASAAEVEAGLEALASIGAGNVEVVTAGSNYVITFQGALGNRDVDSLIGDASGLEGSAAKAVFVSEQIKGFDGHIGEGSLGEATGVAAYSYRAGGGHTDRYVFAADISGGGQVFGFGGESIKTLKSRWAISGPAGGEQFDFGPAGTYIAADPGNEDIATHKCKSIAEQACTSGHFLVYDHGKNAVDEFDASGKFLDLITSGELDDAEPTGLAIDRSGKATDGTIYVTAGPGAGASVRAFGPLAPPSRPALPELSHELATAQAVATDSAGNVYVAAGSTIHVYGPDGVKLSVGPGGNGISTAEPASDLAIDATGKVYMLGKVNTGNPSLEKVQYYTPASYPPSNGTEYSGPTMVFGGGNFQKPPIYVTSIGINPSNNHLFVTSYNGQIAELASASAGSQVLNPCFACGFTITVPSDVAVYGSNGYVYVPEQFGTILVFDSEGTEVVARISGAGSIKGQFVGSPGRVAVDQANGHVIVFNNGRGDLEEYDGSGSFVTGLGAFTTNISRTYGVAVDNSGGAADGSIYLAFDDTAAQTPDLWAYGSLSYGEAPVAVTGLASGVGGGGATVNGTVEPRGSDLSLCRFEYLTDAEYLNNGKTFSGATAVPCQESLVEIGHGLGPVEVHSVLSGIVAGTRYRFRLLATNKYGEGAGKAGVFGPPVLETEAALPVLYDEAAVRAKIDPSGLETKYYVEYGPDEGYGLASTELTLPPGDGPVAVQIPLKELPEGAILHYRVVAENEAEATKGPDQTLITLKRSGSQVCGNTAFRTGLGSKLPDCRAYELVTPAETRGGIPSATIPGTAGQEFNNSLVAQSGPGAGESVAYFTGTLPGFEGSGQTDGYRAQRGQGEHPSGGWTSQLFGPSFAQVGGGGANQHGVAADQSYWFWEVHNFGVVAGGLPTGNYVRTPTGFEPVGQGSLAPFVDLEAESRYVSPGGSHVIFSSTSHLEQAAAPAGTVSLYDHAAGQPDSEVISVGPDGQPFGAGEDAEYLGVTDDGSAVAFSVNGTLYVHRVGQTTEIASAPNTYSGISENGDRIFYMNTTFAGSAAPPAGLFACDIATGGCAGSGSHAPIQIAANSIFVYVSPDGSHVLLTSKDALTGPLDENEAGQIAESGKDNLYAWAGGEMRFAAILDPQDLVSFEGNAFSNVRRWSTAVSAGVGIGIANAPARSTPDGSVFVFQSHAQLTSYDNGGNSEVYRYEPGAGKGFRLICLSCDSGSAPSTGDALLQILTGGGVTQASTVIPNVTDDGNTVFFQSPDRLVPEDANETQDVYEWKAGGVGGCTQPSGCVGLISSGQGEGPSYLFGMSTDGHDVFFETSEKLVGADIPGSPSLYDARVEGGIPDQPVAAPCQGDACQGGGSTPPELAVPATNAAAGDGNVSSQPTKPKCPKGKHRAQRKGKARCVGNAHKKKHQKRAGRGQAGGSKGGVR